MYRAFRFDPLAPSDPRGALEGLGCVECAGSLSGVTSAPQWPPLIPPLAQNAHPKFRDSLNRLIKRVNELGLPLVLGELNRSMERQCFAITEGGSDLKDPSRSAHTAALAADFHLAVNSKKNDPRIIAANGNKWAMGVSADRKSVTNELVRSVWASFGALIAAEFPELEWGGNFGTKGGGYVIGWDPYHVQLKGYTKLLPDQGYWRCDPNTRKPTPADATAAAVAERALQVAQDRPFEVFGLSAGSVVAIVVGSYVAYRVLRRKK